MFSAILLAIATPPLATPAPPPETWDRAAAGFARMMTAEGRVMVRVGERVTITLDKDNRPHVESVEPFAGSAFTTERTAADGSMAFSLSRDAAGGGWLLKVENWLATAVAYGAVLGVPVGDSLAFATTSICDVPSHVVGLERWANPIAMVALGPFQPRAAGAPLTCETLAAAPTDG